MAQLSGIANYPFYYGASPELLNTARELRHSMTPAEKELWHHLRNNQLNGYSFRRQHPISIFIVDFFCYSAKLVIEVDGAVHLDPQKKERDHERTEYMRQLGITLLRFRNDEVLNSIDDVLRRISNVLDQPDHNGY
jgi:very-short-patch-repair endonuclease